MAVIKVPDEDHTKVAYKRNHFVRLVSRLDLNIDVRVVVTVRHTKLDNQNSFPVPR